MRKSNRPVWCSGRESVRVRKSNAGIERADETELVYISDSRPYSKMNTEIEDQVTL